MPHYIHWRTPSSSEFTSTQPLVVNSCGVTADEGESIFEPDMMTHRPQGRQDYQLLYIRRGQGKYLLNGRTRLLPAGTVLLYRPNDPQIYSYRQEFRCQVGWIHFTGAMAQPLMEKCGLMREQVAHVGELPELTRLMLRIISEMQRQEPQYEDQVMAYFLQMTVLIGRRLMKLSDAAGYERAQRIRNAVQYMHQHFDEALNVDHCAQLCALSRHHFIRVFREESGLSPYAYLTELRLTEAARLLAEANLPVSDVARRCGYGDPLYFSRLFKKRYGLSPSSYRQDFALHQSAAAQRLFTP